MTNIWKVPRGYVDVRPNEGTHQNHAQALFKVYYDACERWVTVGYAERVALNWGSGGTGTDFYDGANPFATNAWCVYRFPSTARRPWAYYISFQWSGGGSFGSSPGNPGLIYGTTGGGTNSQIGVQFALAVDADGFSADAWTGTTNFDGADTKGSPVWAAPVGGSVHVWPRSNNPGGSHATLRENYFAIQDGTYLTSRSHIFHDGDHFMLWFDGNDDGFPTGIGIDHIYFGPYKPRNDIEDQIPFLAMKGANDGPGTGTGLSTTTVGDTAGTSWVNGGVLASAAAGVRQFQMVSQGAGSNWTSRTTPLHGIGTETGLPVYPLDIAINESPYLGIVGQTYARRFGYIDSDAVNQHDLHPASPSYEAMIYQFSSASTPAWNKVFMFGGAQTPATTSTRQGVVV